MTVAYGKSGKTVKSVKRRVAGFTVFTMHMTQGDIRGHDMKHLEEVKNQILHLLANKKQDFMEIINIDAQVFQEMKNALAQVIKEIQDRNFFNESLEGWLDGQDVCLLMDISPRKLLSLRSTGAIPFSRIDKKIYYQKKDILEYMKRELQKESLN